MLPYPAEEADEPVTTADYMEAGGKRTLTSEKGVRAAIADAMAVRDDAPELRALDLSPHEGPVELIGRHEGAGRTTRAQEQAFAEQQGFVTKATRRSQRPEGRRERHIRQKAARLGVSYAEAERLTPHGRGHKEDTHA